MNYIKEVFDISNGLVEIAPPIRRHVVIDDAKVKELAATMKESGKVNFYDKEPQEATQYPEEDELAIIARELVASSINYCYWYGASCIRPGGASSTIMYNLVDSAMQFFSPTENQFAGHIDYLIELLAKHRFPMLEERKRHLIELTEGGKGVTFIRYAHMMNAEPRYVFDELIKNFTGFASDIFMKRASLFMIQLYRQLGWFESFMDELFVPADYQLPMILEAFGCMKYSLPLGAHIQECELINKNCLMEVQIRAANIVVCKQLCDLTGWNVADVDTWLWTKRKEFPGKRIHLTRTTDY